MNNTFAIVYAGHGNPLLGDLIEHRCVASLPLAGRFRSIDLILTNLNDSGVRNVGLITQRNFQSLVEHVGSGAMWDMNKKQGGLAVLSPFDQGMSTDLYRGFADALFAKRYYLERQLGKYCLVIYTDTVYRDDYSRLLEVHKDMGADITFLYSKSPKLASDQATGLAQFEVDADGWVRGVNFSTEFDDSSCFPLGAFLMEKDLLVRMVEDACAEGKYSFFSDVLVPALATRKVAAVEHTGYAARISSVKSYFDISRDMFDFDTRQELFFDNGLVHTFDKDVPPVRFVDGCQVQQSVFGNGCVVFGNVEGSVVFRGTSIERDADIKDCIIMQNSRICEGAYLRNAIIDKDVVIGPGVRIVGTPDMPAVVRKGSVIVA